MKFSVAALLTLCLAVFGYDRDELLKNPASQSNFNLDQWLGKWYIQYRLAPCTWAASSEFVDWTRIFTNDAKSVIDKESWESKGACAEELFARFYQAQTNNGLFKVKDALGGIISGKMVVPATDYKSFSISWTCVKPSVDEGICSDVALVVETRRPFPAAHTLDTIDAILRKLWGLSLTEMIKYQHTNACPQPFHAAPAPAPLSRKTFATY